MRENNRISRTEYEIFIVALLLNCRHQNVMTYTIFGKIPVFKIQEKKI